MVGLLQWGKREWRFSHCSIHRKLSAAVHVSSDRALAERFPSFNLRPCGGRLAAYISLKLNNISLIPGTPEHA
jgi:hypothetical protein